MAQPVRCRPRRRFAALATGLLAVLPGCAACGSPRSGESVATARPHFSAIGSTGETLGFPGAKASVVYFFASGCKQGAPAVAAAKLRAPQATYVAVGLDPEASPQQMRSVLGSVGVSDLAVAADPDAAIMISFGVFTVGTTLVLDSAGKVVYTRVEASTDQIVAAVARATAR